MCYTIILHASARRLHVTQLHVTSWTCTQCTQSATRIFLCPRMPLRPSSETCKFLPATGIPSPYTSPDQPHGLSQLVGDDSSTSLDCYRDASRDLVTWRGFQTQISTLTSIEHSHGTDGFFGMSSVYSVILCLDKGKQICFCLYSVSSI